MHCKVHQSPNFFFPSEIMTVITNIVLRSPTNSRVYTLEAESAQLSLRELFIGKQHMDDKVLSVEFIYPLFTRMPGETYRRDCFVVVFRLSIAD